MAMHTACETCICRLSKTQVAFSWDFWMSNNTCDTRDVKMDSLRESSHECAICQMRPTAAPSTRNSDSERIVETGHLWRIRDHKKDGPYVQPFEYGGPSWGWPSIDGGVGYVARERGEGGQGGGGWALSASLHSTTPGDTESGHFDFGPGSKNGNGWSRYLAKYACGKKASPSFVLLSSILST